VTHPCHSLSADPYFFHKSSAFRGKLLTCSPQDQADGTSSFGTYYFIFAEGIVASIFVWFFLPETKGRALEELDAVFALPWYKIGRVGRMYADDKGLGLIHVSDEVASAAGTEKVEIRRDDQFDKV